jgi:hypothetical protein
MVARRIHAYNLHHDDVGVEAADYPADNNDDSGSWAMTLSASASPHSGFANVLAVYFADVWTSLPPSPRLQFWLLLSTSMYWHIN